MANSNTQDWVRALYDAAHIPDVLDPVELARHARVPREVVQHALLTGQLAGSELEPGEWRITRRAALAWIEGGSVVRHV